MTSPSFTDDLRRRVREKAGVCPTCGQPTTDGGIRALAEATGVQHTTLWRFLRGGVAQSTVIDRLVRWLDEPAAAIEEEPE